ncbi:MAG: very short patch repair endonuclease, partial [Duncaniella sp.]|nr:very short patch repair endonuclease [Duncaniella sp.]
MQANKSRDTKPELALGSLLCRCGIRYRKHSRRVAGKPDFCISKYRLAIFVDGELSHGRDWERRRTKLKSNRDLWIAKI